MSIPPKPELKAPDLIRLLHDHDIEFVVIGGVACVLHGCNYVTEDLDVCAPMTEANLTKIIRALADFDPRLRMRPDRMPLPTEMERLRGIKNLYLQTKLGLLDMLGEVPGIGNFEITATQSVPMNLGGVPIRVLALDALIIAKRTAGRRKDLEMVTSLERLQKLSLFRREDCK